MRLIKFRAHSKTGPLWVYGYYKYIRCFDQHVIENKNGVYDVDGDTVGQYWRTVNNQEIYDGDVFTVNGKYPKLVKWVEEYACFCIANIDDIGDIWVNPWQTPALNWFKELNREIKVIGNIHDNPELMDGKIELIKPYSTIHKRSIEDDLLARREREQMEYEKRKKDVIDMHTSCSLTISDLSDGSEELVFSIKPIREDLFDLEDSRTTDRHSTYYIPPHFSIFGSSRPLRKERPALPTKKVERNVRPKGTHTHFRFYR